MVTSPVANVNLGDGYTDPDDACTYVGAISVLCLYQTWGQFDSNSGIGYLKKWNWNREILN